MDLKNTIDNTNTQKENIKIVATSIDNKLIELGGEQAINLSDVSNKMGVMVKENYNRVAVINKAETIRATVKKWNKMTINFNLTFTPKRIFVKLKEQYPMIVDSNTNTNENNSTFGYSHRVFINNVNKDSCDINIMSIATTGFDVNLIEILAIG